MQHYTYAHYRPDGSVFYIGKGCGDRAYRTGHRNPHWHRTIAKHGPHTVEILARWATHEEALAHEVFLIACFRDMGERLTNLTDGGEGVVGHKWTAEQRARMSQVKRGKPSGGRGIKRKPHTEETKSLMSLKRKGIRFSEEHKIKISASKKGIATSVKRGDKLPEGRAKKMAEILVRARQNMKPKTGIPVEQVECPACGKVGGKGAMRRWHFDNCKDKNENAV